MNIEPYQKRLSNHTATPALYERLRYIYLPGKLFDTTRSQSITTDCANKAEQINLSTISNCMTSPYRVVSQFSCPHEIVPIVHWQGLREVEKHFVKGDHTGPHQLAGHQSIIGAKRTEMREKKKKTSVTCSCRRKLRNIGICIWNSLDSFHFQSLLLFNLGNEWWDFVIELWIMRIGCVCVTVACCKWPREDPVSGWSYIGRCNTWTEHVWNCQTI